MTTYDENLKTIYGKEEPVLSEADLDRLEDESFAERARETGGFENCPQCKGECQLAGGEIECVDCPFCSL